VGEKEEAMGLYQAVVVATAGVLAPYVASATNGASAIGYGARQRGVGGAAVGFPQGPLSGAANPANLSFVDAGFELSLEVFLPDRAASLDTALKDNPDTVGLLGEEKVSATSDSPFFMVPNAAVSWRLGEGLTGAFIAYANGGMNTDYAENVFHKSFAKPLEIFSAAAAPAAGVESTGPERAAVSKALGEAPNTGRLGVNLEQLIFAPSLAWEPTPGYSVGVSLLLAFQRFRAEGLGDFVGFSSNPSKLTNNGDSYSFGAGVRGGVSARPAHWITVGAAASTKVYMTPFEDYAGLFAEGGDFDVPSTLGVGLSVNPIRSLTLAADVSRILWTGVKSVSNRGPTGEELLGGFNTVLGNAYEGAKSGTAVPLNKGVAHALGEDDGYGFGWQDIWVLKVGVAFAPVDALTLRAGYNYGESPIPDDQTLFNILAPGVTTHHFTGGASYRFTALDELSVAYMWAPRQTQGHEYRTSGEPFGFPSFTLGYDTEIEMEQQVAELAYRRAF
jgi:long-chain fatty acid transport protein